MATNQFKVQPILNDWQRWGPTRVNEALEQDGGVRLSVSRKQTLKNHNMSGMQRTSTVEVWDFFFFWGVTISSQLCV